MLKNITNPEVDAYINQITLWKAETKALREIILACGLTEELKWGKPCIPFKEKI